MGISGIGLNAKKKFLLLIVVHSLLVTGATHNLWIVTLGSWEIMEMDSSFLLHLGMDGPNVNEKFENDLATELKEKSDTN